MSRMGDLAIFSHNLNSLSEREFENEIVSLIQKQQNFKNLTELTSTKDGGYDLAADEISNGKGVRAIFQLKKSELITPDYIQNIGDYWAAKDFFKNSKLYLVTSGTITQEASLRAEKYGIEVWDIYKLYMLDELSEKKERRERKTRENASKPQSKEEELSFALKNIAKGHANWSDYQQLSCNIFSHLFSPPLTQPRYNFADADDRNRRDMIFENSTEHSFWKNIKDTYKADYIVVDAKNSAELIDKRPVIEIAHYLKPYGCGMFGLLLVREGASDAANHAIKEQWIGNNKMIVALNDKDISEMLKMKQQNGKPEEIIKMKIADFRMSL